MKIKAMQITVPILEMSAEERIERFTLSYFSAPRFCATRDIVAEETATETSCPQEATFSATPMPAMISLEN